VGVQSLKRSCYFSGSFLIMRFITTPKILRLFYPSLVWEMPKGEKKIYLTFDDGPHPTITPQV
jgi:peptidoglycan/xylan/chitin deacetylase (PgdA/CDA1 family)